MSVMYRLSIQPGCLNCGRCSYILPGWPDEHQKRGLLISERSLSENGDHVDRVVASCPLDLIELNEVK